MEEQREDKQEKRHEKVSMLGKHMDQEDVKTHVMKLIEQRAYLDSQCFMLLNKLCEIVSSEEGDALVKARIETNDELMKVIAGDVKTLCDLGFKGTYND